MRLFPGTLNIHLIDQKYPMPADILRLEAEEYGGSVSMSTCPCEIFGRRAFILRPDNCTGRDGDPPEAVLEVATDVKLRDVFGISDGGLIEVEV
jgi:CTP-dependent riboflavin kinase